MVIGAGPAGEAAAHKARVRGRVGGHRGQGVVRGLLSARRLRPVQEPAPRRGPPRVGRGLLVGPGIGPPRLHGQPARRRGRARRHARTSGRSRPPGRSSGAARAGSRRRAWSTVTHAGTTQELRARNVVVAVGSTSKLPPIEGLAETRPWTNREATLARELPRSLLVLGGGPTGCELAQVYARFGVPVTIVQSGPRLAPTEHPRSSEAIRFALERDGVTVRTGVRALRARAGAGTRRGARRRARRRVDRGGPRDPARRRARVPARGTSAWSTTAWPSRGRTRTAGTGRCGSPTACGSPATPPGPSSTPTRATTRASWSSGWPSARP